MPPELAAQAGDAGRLGRNAASPWRMSLALLAGVWIGLIALCHEDWRAMAGQWWSSSTYSHILLVPAILVWLVHIRASELSELAPRAWWPGLVGSCLAAVVWLVGSVADVSLVSQAGAVALLMAAAITMLGPKVAVGLAFPLAYMAFLVPLGDEFMPTLQMITARLTTALVHLSGISATIDGVFIDTPAGLFEVAEACSGVKFLVAMAALGALVANVCLRSWPRRVAFMAFALVLPVLANGLRAWATIYIAQFVGAERATGFDHIVYGWIFFALVIAAVLGLSWRFFDRGPADPMIDAKAIAASPLLSRLEHMSTSGPLGASLIIAIAALASARAVAADRLAAPVPDRLSVPIVAGWAPEPLPSHPDWQPRAGGASAKLLARYRRSDGAQVDVFLAVFSSLGKGRDPGAFGEGAVPPTSGWAWLAPGAPMADATVDRLLGPGRSERLAATTYRTGSLLTGSNARLKLTTVVDRLRLRARPTVVLIVSAERSGENDAAQNLRAFRASVGPLGAWMDRAAGLR